MVLDSDYQHPVILHVTFGLLALVSVALLIWQWIVGRMFPLHERIEDVSFAPPVTLLKPLKGCDPATEACLRSWFDQQYPGKVQILFGVGSADDPATDLVRRLIAEYPNTDAELVVCDISIGSNAKVSKLVALQARSRHDVFVVSDADVFAPVDLVKNLVAQLRRPEIGLANSLYRLANPSTLAMQWEAIGVNADFWSQVLQANQLKPLDFALGAVMATRRQLVEEIGGFKALANCLADDYQLGNRIALSGYQVALCPVVVDCFEPRMNWRRVWRHQVRWARTIRACRPFPYLCSILSNATLWPLLWVVVSPAATRSMTVIAVSACLVLRILAAHDLQRCFTQTSGHVKYLWLVPIKDLLQTIVWFLAFTGNRIDWRGQRFRLRSDGTLVAENADVRQASL